MLELYIANQKADIPENFSVLFNYNSTEVSNPTAIKNKYTSSLILPGTPENNKIFGDIWKLGRILIPKTSGISDQHTTGKLLNSVHFDPRKRVDFKIYNNSDLIECGYLQLLEVNIELPEISYRIQLYGGLGDFFYTLQYDEDNVEKNLASLYWGWLGSQEDENSLPLGYWNADFISQSWGNLGTAPVSHTIDEDITAIPTYSGQYDDFSGDKVLVNVPSLSGYYSDYATLFPSSLTDDGQTYSLYNSKYALLETPRNLSEWEARDLRSTQQRVGLRFSSFFDAISNPLNNGGYDVVLDPEIKETPYYNKSWILLDRPQFSDNGVPTDESPGFGGTKIDMLDTDATVNAQLIKKDSTVLFNNTEITRFSVDLGMSLDFIAPYSYIDPNMFCNIFEYRIIDWDDSSLSKHYVIWDDIGIRIEMYDAYSPIIATSPIYILYSSNPQYNINDAELGLVPSIGNYTPAAQDIKDYAKGQVVSKVNSTYGGSTTECIPISYNRTLDESWDDSSGYHHSYNVSQGQNPLGPAPQGAIRLVWDNMPVHNNYQIRFRFFRIRTTAEMNNKEEYPPSTWTWTTQISSIKQWYQWGSRGGSDETDYDNEVGNTFTLNSQVYPTDTYFFIKSAWFGDATESNQLLPKSITKDELFATSSNPLKYLLDWTKMFDLRFRTDQYQKIVYIDKRNNYYQDERIDLRVNLAKGIKMDPTVAKYKSFTYGLPVPETYMSELYDKKTSEPYGKVKLNTGYEFNNENKDLYEDSVYKALIPYAMNSYYFSHQGTGDIPSVALSPTYDYTLYNLQGNYTKTQSEAWGSISSTYSIDYYDPVPKLCIFSNDENSIASINSIVFYNGMYANSEIQLSDNTKAMVELNESPCYLLSRDSNEVNVPSYIPFFSNSFISPGDSTSYLYSFNFAAPVKEVKNAELDYTYRAPIYYGFWDEYTQDLYNPNGKSIQVYAFLEGRPEDMMRKFWYFNDAIWIIDQIKNYNISDPDTPVQMVLIKVENPENYLIHY